ncbi:MAG: SH3 domain-containing protein [Limisphaerales bacterium]
MCAGLAGLKGEVIEKLTKGDVVTVISQSNLTKHAVGEPSQWAKIALPGSTKIWLNSSFVNPLSKKVVVKKLNLRAGPGENYSVLGTIERGTVVGEIKKMGAWMQIEPPANAYAFVAAMYLKQEASGTMSTNAAPSMETEPVPVPVTTPVAETQPIVTEPTNAVVAAARKRQPIRRIWPRVQQWLLIPIRRPRALYRMKAWWVSLTASSPRPPMYCMTRPRARRSIFSTRPPRTSTSDVTTRCASSRPAKKPMAERWPNTPVLTIQRIEVLQTNTTQKVYYPAPRQRN